MRIVRRRAFLTSVAAGLTGLAAAIPILDGASAQTKVTKQQAKYQDKPKGDQRCSGCVNFIAPSSCRFVEGQISPNGWCSLFAAKSS